VLADQVVTPASFPSASRTICLIEGAWQLDLPAVVGLFGNRPYEHQKFHDALLQGDYTGLCHFDRSCSPGGIQLRQSTHRFSIIYCSIAWPVECIYFNRIPKRSSLMKVRIRHGKNYQTEAFTRFHRVVCDQPLDEGGSDTSMTPPELMLAALGCCAMHYAGVFLGTRGLALDDVEIRISAVKGGQPLRLTEIGMEVDAPGLNTKARAGLMKAIEACLLHRTLADPPKVKISMTTVVTEGPSASTSVDLAS
jgi:putative redox protein